MTEAGRVEQTEQSGVRGGLTAAQVVIVGAGPAGLTAAFELAGRGAAVTVLEKDVRPGGIARTEAYKGYHFDIGGHRFFTKEPEVNRLWQQWLGPEFLRRPRQLAHLLRRPLLPLSAASAFNALSGLGLLAERADPGQLRTRRGCFPHRSKTPSSSG